MKGMRDGKGRMNGEKREREGRMKEIQGNEGWERQMQVDERKKESMKRGRNGRGTR